MNMSRKFQTSTRKSPSVILRKRRADNERVHFNEDFDEETSIFRKLCLLPFEPMWYYFIVIIGLINSVTAMLNCISYLCGSTEHQIATIFYFADVAWFINTTILIIDQYHIQNLRSTQMIFSNRALIWFIIDYVSILPFELMVPMNLKAYLGLNKMLKIFYILWVCYFVSSMLDSSMSILVFDLICKLLYFITFVALIFTIILFNFDANPKRYDIADIFYLVTDHMTLKGFGQIATQHYWNKLLAITCSLILFVGVLIICTANVTFSFFTKTTEKTAFCYKYNCLKDQMQDNRLHPEFNGVLDIFFNTMWSHARGLEVAMGGRRQDAMRASRHYSDDRKVQILPMTLLSEIKVDMSTGMFRHSILFRDIPLAFLRDLASYVTYEVYLQYQLINKLDELKDKMIYIYKGTVEIISDEDGETPIVKLTAGTVFSEICLILPYKSNFLVRCGTTCIFHILRRNDFIKVLDLFPGVRRKINRLVQSRLVDARILKRIQDIYNTRADMQNKCTNVGWLLHTMHKLTAIAYPHAASQHTLTNIRLAHLINTNRFRNHIYSPCYLPLYAVPKEGQDYKDTLFAKSTFPYVLKPNTGLTLFWEIFIATMAVVAAFLIPFYAFTYEHSNKKAIYHTAYIFTCLWILDIIIQLRISIIYEKKVVSGSFDILIMKLTSYVFLLDILSIIPVELFTGILVQESNQNYVYLNRILKLARVVRLLMGWESRYNSNPLFVRFIFAISFLVYAVFLTSCIFYYIGYRGDGGLVEFVKLLFYTSQMLTGVSVWVDGYSEGFPPYQIANIILYLIICINYALMYGMIFSAYASILMHVLRLKYNTSALIKAAVQIDPRYAAYIHAVLSDAVAIDKGFTVHLPGYLYNTVPTEIVGFIYESSFEAYIDEFLIFARIPRLQRKQIFVESAYLCNYTPNEVIFHVGDLLNELYLLIAGCCEVICGVTLKSDMVNQPTELNSVEVGLAIPMRTTVITHSHCRILRIKYSMVRRVLLELGSRLSIRSQLEDLQDLRARIVHSQLHYFNTDLLDNLKNDMLLQSYVHFNRVDGEYLLVYKATGLFKLRWLFMNLTFCPSGNFFHIWEIIRCVCAVLSALLFTSITVCFYKVPHPVGVFKWALEVMAIADIYIRMHVAFYNDKGLLVTHPALTSVHYIKYGFLIDFLGALPLHMGISQAEHVILNMNKLLQLHRFISFMRFKKNDSVVPPNMLYLFAHVPAMMIYMNIMASLVLLLNCTFDVTDRMNARIDCPSNSIFYSAEYPITDPSTAHVHAIYIILSICSKTAVQGFVVTGRRNMLVITLMTVIGFCLDIFYAAQIYVYFVTIYVETMYNDLRMKVLRAFLGGKLRSCRVNPALIRQAENQIKRKYIMGQSNVHYNAKQYPSNLRRDILYNQFAPVLVKSLLAGAREIEPFVRNLLVNSQYIALDANMIVQRKNDICECTVILYSGLVHIDLTNDAENPPKINYVSLGPGSILGNLGPLQYNRLKVTITAIGVLELLCIKTKTFFEIMQHFPNCQEKFLALRLVHISHVPGKSKFEYTKPRSKRQWTFKRFQGCAWFILNLLNIAGAFISQLYYFYDIITVNINFNYNYLVFDVLYLGAMFMIFFLPITTARGDYMSWKNVLYLFYKPWLFYISVFAAVPFYVCVPWNLDGLLTYYVLTAARSNVLLRSFFFFKVMNTTIAHSTSMMYSLMFILNVMIIVLTVGGATALLILISDVDVLNMQPYINLRALINAPPEEKFNHMVTYLYIVTNMFTHTSQSIYYPIGLIYTVIFIILMGMVMIYNTVIYSLVVSMVQAIQQLKLSYQIEKREILAMMQRSDTSSIVEDRLRYYCKMSWNTMKGFKIPNLFLELPVPLREDIAEELFEGILDEHVLFTQLHYELRRQLYAKLKLDYFYHGDFISYYGTVNETMYFVYKGSVVSLADDNTTVMATIEKGGCFAIMQGITNNFPHEFSYRAMCDTVILYLVKSDWDYMLHFFPASNNIMTMIATALFEKPHND